MTIEGIDCLQPVSTEQALQLRELGYGFVCRYIGSKGDNSLTRHELDGLHAAGLSVVLIYETTGQQALGGAAAGGSIGTAAGAAAAALGAPAGSTVYVAETDFDVQSDQVGAMRAFYSMASSALRTFGYGLGAYGGLRAVTTLGGVGAYLWQTYAWSQGQWAPSAALQQYQNGVVVAGIDCDLTRAVINQYGQWAPPAPVNDDTGDNDVPIRVTIKAADGSVTTAVVTASGAAFYVLDDPANDLSKLASVVTNDHSWNAAIGAGKINAL